jgi:hypothetical protein
MLHSAPFVERLKDFFKVFSQTRNTIVHGVYQPKLDETDDCVTTAIAIYNIADVQLNKLHPTPLEPPDLSPE